ncbi:MAG: beta-phosphoglucomutase [Oscillospiraceae bacterium]|nr:beta-phosphoglucomutase [Oscillospiraceae bacterium]
MIKAIIFDLDGVLTKSDRYHTSAWRQTCEQWAIPFADSTGDLVRGVSRLDSARIVATQGGAELTETQLAAFAEEKNSRYVRLLKNMSAADVLPGVTALLEYLREAEIPIAVASSSKNAPLILEKTGLKDYFPVIVDGSRIARSKPDPEVFQKAADTLNIPYGDCLVVEDAVSGVQAALTLGCQVAAVGEAAMVEGVSYPLKETGDLLEVVSSQLMPHLRIFPHPKAPDESIITDGDYRITVMTDRLFRIERGGCTDEATQTIWYRDFPPVRYSWEADGTAIRINTDALTLVIDKADFPNSTVTFASGARAKLDNSENLLGTCSTLDTNGSHLRENPSVNRYDREHIPLDMGVCARNGVAVYDDSRSLLLYPSGKLVPRSGGMDSYVFAYGHDYPAAVRTLYRLCGDTPVVPRWALGNWWCRYWPYTQQAYIDLMDNFADDGIPISVAVIDMDWHYVQVDRDFGIRKKGLDDDTHGGTDGWTGYTWNEKLFPDHAALLKELHKRGMHTTLNLHPALGVRWYEKPYRRMAESMGMNPDEKLVIPFQIENGKFVNHYLNLLHHPLEAEGVDFWWIDWQQGKDSGLAGLNPMWALNHYHYLDNAHRKGQGLILSRYAGAGSHRYPVGFSGDIHMDWEFLDYMPYFTATAANIGYGWWSHDIGGHHRGLRDEELYLRWLQFGVFSPINRIHCCPAEVTSKEPWTLSEPMRATAEKWFRLRHTLVPYLYSASWKNTLEGIPLIRPMYYEWPEEDAAYEADHQYLFGDLLVAPITEKSRELGMADKKVWLPEGIWTDIFTDITYTGGRWVSVYRDSGTMPVFARAGTILPLDAAVKNNCAEPEKLDVYVYSGDGSYTLHESRDECTVFTVQSVTKHQLQVYISGNTRGMTYRVFFKNIDDGICSLKVNGAPADVTLRHNRCLQASFTLEAGAHAELTVDWKPRDSLDIIKECILKRFIQLPLDNWYKEKQWEIAGNIENINDWLQWIESLKLCEVGKGMLKEQLYSVHA